MVLVILNPYFTAFDTNWNIIELPEIIDVNAAIPKINGNNNSFTKYESNNFMVNLTERILQDNIS